ncbi:hypothetical protein AX15_003213 [Amanita polypyramis BW_CC]|nr:hypothetical protein AX15_003213 [Amanita polypyramis BW_CC]
MEGDRYMSATGAVLTATAPVLGKRKTQKEYIIHLASSPEPSANDTDYENIENQPRPKPMLVNGALVGGTKKRYKCTFLGCEKAYTKPSRLSEHERTHTGERPFTCDACDKSYFRETHLQAHARVHLPQSARSLACPEPNCDKRFWTSQHLRVHLEWHKGAKPFACTEGDCDEVFAKQHQLRSHMSTFHAPPGTKLYRCDHGDCTKSFSTNQHLRTHKKTHDEKRYTCVHSSCLATSNNEPKFFPTWTALQQHMRIAHPPTCTHPTCDGRVFSCHKNLRAHQKLHSLRDLEDQVNSAVISDTESTHEPPTKRRRGGELGRDWKCSLDGCEKDFKSKKALTTHINVSHLGKKDFACLKCGVRYGYKHLLQRHFARQHKQTPGSASDDSGGSVDEDARNESPIQERMDINTITGSAYAKRAQVNVRKALRCPYPDLGPITSENVVLHEEEVSRDGCYYVFSRAYDIRRHLRAVHGIEAEKEAVDKWAKGV